MQAAYVLFRLSTQILSGVIGSMAVFMLYFAGQVPEFQASLRLLANALFWGASASAIIYFQGKYLN